MISNVTVETATSLTFGLRPSHELAISRQMLGITTQIHQNIPDWHPRRRYEKESCGLACMEFRSFSIESVENMLHQKTHVLILDYSQPVCLVHSEAHK